MTSAERVHDTFCWHCCGTGTTLNCSNCVRSFHIECETQNDPEPTNDVNWLCSVCTTLKESQNVNIQEDRNTLPILINRVCKGKMFKTLKRPLEMVDGLKSGVADSIVNPMNLRKIREKADSYASYYELYIDALWMLHNCVILFSEHHEKTIVAQYLLNYIDGEIASVKKCAECYSRAFKYSKTWFTMVCTEPHLIVWAKIVGFNYWPAKVMSVNGPQVNVRFFGDHTYADVPASSCYLYSETSPKIPRTKSPEYGEALKEARVYIKNICKKYGSFQFAPTKTPFDTKFMQEYIERMIPEIVVRREKESEMVDIQNDEMEEMSNSEDPENDAILLDSEEDVNSEQSKQSPERTTIHDCKDLVICLRRVDEIHLESGTPCDGSKQEPMSVDDNDSEQAPISVEDSNSEQEPISVEDNDSKHDSVELNYEPPQKKVRFRDEYGEDLVEVQIIEPIENEYEVEDVEPTDEAETESSEDGFAQMVTLDDANHMTISTISDEPMENTETQNIETQDFQNGVDYGDAPNAGAEDNEPNVGAHDNAPNAVAWNDNRNSEACEDAQNTEANAQNVRYDLSRLSSMELEAYQKVVKLMKGVEGNILKYFHMSQLRSDALNMYLKSSKVTHAKEIAALRAHNEELMVRSETATFERNETIQQANNLIITIKEDFSQQMALLERAKIETELLKNNEILELKNQVEELKHRVEDVYQEKANSELQLKQKYLDIIDKMRKDADRKLIKQSRCKGCDKALEYCSPICEQMWNAWKNPKPEGDNIEK